MDIPKTRQATDAPQTVDPVKIDPQAPVPAAKRKSVEILELSLEEEPNMGSDPYNNTGEHIILKLREDAKR